MLPTTYNLLLLLQLLLLLLLHYGNLLLPLLLLLLRLLHPTPTPPAADSRFSLFHSLFLTYLDNYSVLGPFRIIVLGFSIADSGFSVL